MDFATATKPSFASLSSKRSVTSRDTDTAQGTTSNKKAREDFSDEGEGHEFHHVLPPSSPSEFTATSSLGRRVDIRLRPLSVDTTGASSRASALASGTKGLLLEGLKTLERRLEETWAQQEVERLEREAHRVQQPASSSASGGASRDDQEHALWVDKYRSSKYSDLLSDEKMNRDVLKWVKSWDAAVHPKQSSVKSAGASGTPSDDPRPEQRLLLIAGPPGLGKTTLVHAVAKAAGYRVAEVNASDERSAKVLEEIVGNAMGNTSVTEGEKPCLVILDEIDGVDGEGAIEFLVQMMKDDKPKVTRPLIAICNDLYASALRPLRKSARILRMDSVRQERLMARLRDICRAEGVSRLLDDAVLGYLCQMTNCDARSSINTLQFITKASSLRRGVPITVDTLTRLNISPLHVANSGAHLGFFQALSLTFTMQPAVTRTQRGTVNIDKVHHFQQVWRHVQDANHDNVLADALFTNYLSLPSLASDLTRVGAMSEWFALYDTCLMQIHQLQHFEMQGVIPVLGVAANHYLGMGSYVAPGATLRNLQFPKEEGNLYKAMTHTRDTVRDYLGSLQGCEALHYLGMDVATNLHQRLPYTLSVLDPLQPAYSTWLGRNVDPQKREQIMKQITQGMSFYGLDYIVADEAGHSQSPNKRRAVASSTPPRYRLDPPLDALVHTFDVGDAPFASSAQHRDHEAILHMIFLKMRPQVITTSRTHEAPSTSHGAASLKVPTSTTTQPSPQGAVLRDFFGRVLEATPVDPAARLLALRKEQDFLKSNTATREHKARLTLVEAEMADLERKLVRASRADDATLPLSTISRDVPPAMSSKATPVRFKYNAGATQAVRRTLYIKDFL